MILIRPTPAEAFGQRIHQVANLCMSFRPQEDISRLERLCTEAREAELTEFIEEEEQRLDRLPRWYRELRGDLLRIPATREAVIDLKRCQERFEVCADHVFAAPGQFEAPPVRPRDIEPQAGRW